MKIYLLTDLEGATGVFKFSQTRAMGTPEGIEAMRLLMGDITAVVAGLRQAGATEIMVLDGHDGGNNFLPEEMVAGARYVTGKPRPWGLYGLDRSFAGMVVLGAHAMNGTADGVLHHTQSSIAEAKYWYDGVERGEIFQAAVTAGHYDVPVIMVTGDEAACREARELLGDDLPAASVKKGISREAAVLMPPAETRPLLTEVAKAAAAGLARRRPFKPTFPIQLRERRLGPNPASLDTPWFVERVSEVRGALDIIRGSTND